MNTTKIVSVAALVIAFIALILAWTAYNRTGVDFEQVVQSEVNEAMIEINANLQRWQEEVRDNTAEQLRESAEEVDTDEETATTTE